MLFLRKTILLAGAAALGFLLWTCGNIWPSGQDNRKLTAEGCISLGMEYERDGNYTKALEYYTDATEMDSFLTDGWYYKAKMELRIEGIILPMLAKELLSENGKKLPFFPDTGMDDRGLDSLYDKLVFLFKPSIAAYQSLLKIFNGPAVTGTFTRDIILSDFTMLSALNTALLTLDNAPKDGQLTADYSPANTERRLYKTLGGGLTNIDSIRIDVEGIKSLFSGPQDINVMVDGLISSANISLASINEWDAEIQASTAKDIPKSLLRDPRAQMERIILNAAYYYYNDRKDNDYDYWDSNRDGVKQRMIWIDTSGHADAGNPGRNHIDWYNAAGDTHFNITDTLERMSTDPVYKHSDVYFGDTLVDGDRHFFFKGGNGGEFVAGDWGADEEQLDDFDNDGDGRKDEDSRVGSDSMDQDNDFIKVQTVPLAVDTIGSNQSGKLSLDRKTNTIKNTCRMMWVDRNGNFRIDGPDSLLTTAYVLAHYDTISKYINAGAGYGEWISGDWGIDEEYVDGIDNDGDGRIDEDGDIHFIHRWAQNERDAYLTNLKGYFSVPAHLDSIKAAQ